MNASTSMAMSSTGSLPTLRFMGLCRASCPHRFTATAAHRCSILIDRAATASMLDGAFAHPRSLHVARTP
jgi:hypothetical protein